MSDQSCPAIDEIHHRSLMNRVKGHVTNESSVTQKAFKSNRQQSKVGKFEWPNLWMKHYSHRRWCARYATANVHEEDNVLTLVWYIKLRRSDLPSSTRNTIKQAEANSLTRNLIIHCTQRAARSHFFFIAKFHAAAVSPKAKPTSFSIVCVPATSINRAIKSIE